MTQTYAQLQKQIARLQKEADSLRVKEVAGVVARIKVAIEHYGLTAEQLGFSGDSKAKARAAAVSMKTTKVKAKASAANPGKYTDGNGNFWSGRGRFRPSWVNDALAAGKTLEDLLAGGSAQPAKASKASAKAARRRAPKVLYRDGAGNSWTGMGPKPRWLKQALDGGITLEQLKS